MTAAARCAVIATCLWFATAGRGQEGAASPASSPRLVVLCAIDQLSAWAFEAARSHLPADGGFRRLLDHGVFFSRCAYEHACSETGPGHATIGTGAPASEHGIVRNAWWSSADKALVYCVQEAMPPLPGLREGKDRGPGRLCLPTFADGLKAAVAGAKIASVSWKDRAAILMVGRGADVAAWFEATTGNLVTNTAWVQATPPWIASFNEQRAIDTFHGFVWDRIGPPQAYDGLVDDRPWEVPHQNGNNQRTLPQPVTGGRADPGSAYYGQVYSSPIGNTVVRLAAEAAVKGMQLGADDVPDLLCVSFSSLDLVGHQFGPESVEARDVLLRLDRELAAWLAFLDREVGAGRWALFLTSDHGIGATPEWLRGFGVDAGRGLLQTQARAAAEQALARRFGQPPGTARYVSHVGEFSLHLDRDVLGAVPGGRDDAAVLEAARIAAVAATRVKGIAAAFATGDLSELAAADDPLQQSLRKALFPGRAGDVQLVVRPHWVDGVVPASHGTPHAYDRQVVAFAIGPGVPAGARVDAPVTPGLGVVWFASLLGIPRPPRAADTLPRELTSVR